MTRTKRRNPYEEKQCGAMIIRGGDAYAFRQRERRGSACDQAERMLGTSSILRRPASQLALDGVRHVDSR
jgi:hypothetical protein